jgi:hypothetical protein
VVVMLHAQLRSQNNMRAWGKSIPARPTISVL